MSPEEYYNFEDRVYVNPTISRDEQMAFIDKLRGIQQQANEEIEAQTYALGTQVPLNQGGLTSGATDENSYFMSRFQTPQVNNQVAKLKTAAQQTALNYILKNQSSQMEKRYTDAYQAYLKRQYDMNKRHWQQSNRGSGGGGSTSSNIKIDTEATKPVTATPTTDAISVSYTPSTGAGTFLGRGITAYTESGIVHINDTATGRELWQGKNPAELDKGIYSDFARELMRQQNVGNPLKGTVLDPSTISVGNLGGISVGVSI